MQPYSAHLRRGDTPKGIQDRLYVMPTLPKYSPFSHMSYHWAYLEPL
jgi:hypothetical protein